MFNLFKKKYTRSDWFSGLIIAEDYVSRGLCQGRHTLLYS